MQVETVVVGANSCGVLEIIDDNETGLLFENQNSKDLADKIEVLYHDEELKNRLAKAGRAKAEDKFSSVRQFEKLAEMLLKLK
jgi:glycosyltransferase involved in cell wall biosynthesis